MESIYIEQTEMTPEVKLDAEKKLLFIGGASYPENSFEFYSPILNWIDKYLNELTEEQVIVFRFDYFNTGSSKCIMRIISLFDEAYKNGKKVKIEWHYIDDNEAVKECGEEFQETTQTPFELKLFEESKTK